MQDLIFACGDLPKPGQTVLARMNTGQGGKGSNQAIACGRVGPSTVFIGATGDDAFANRVEQFYRRARIGCRLARKPEQPSGTAIVMLDHSGQNQIVIEPGANSHFAAEDIDARLIHQAKVVIAQLECNQAATAHALRTARRAGATTVLNPAPMRKDFDTKMLGHVDVLVPNESEFAALVRCLPRLRKRNFNERSLRALKPAALHALCRMIGVPTVIITLGERGCFVSEHDQYRALPAYRGVKVVDTTGAGDAFCGGFAAGLLRNGGGVVDAAKFGMAVAALSITKPGAAGAMPTRVELRNFLRRRKG